MFSSRMKLVDEVNCKVMKVFMRGWEYPGSSCTSCSSSSSSTRERPIFLPQLDNKSTATLKLILKKILQRTRVQLNKPIENNISILYSFAGYSQIQHFNIKCTSICHFISKFAASIILKIHCAFGPNVKEPGAGVESMMLKNF